MQSFARQNRHVIPRPRLFTFRIRFHLAFKLAAALLLILLNLSVSQTTLAGQLSALINGKAIHMNTKSNTNYNEENWGAGAQYEFGNYDDKWIPFTAVSGFLDSSKNPSYYLGGGYVRRFMLSERLDQLHFDIGLIGFFMSRKDYRDGDLFPGVLPMLSFGTRTASVNITYVPEVAPKMVELWFFQLKLTVMEF